MSSELVNYAINFDEMDQQLTDYAKEHLNEDPDTNLQILSEFRDLIYERGECYPYRMDDTFLLRFLRARKFVVRHAHRLLVNHCNFKQNNVDLYDVNFDRLVHAMAYNIFTSMPFCDEGNRRICIFRPAVWNTDIVTAYEMMQFFIFQLEVCMWEPRSQIAGAVGIFDLSCSSLKHVWLLTPSTINKIRHLMFWSPLRVHKIHIVNETSVFSAGFTMVKPFLGSEVHDFVVFHGNNLKSLHEHVSPKYLPERYGGIHPDYTDLDWLEVIASRKDLLGELERCGYKFGDELVAKFSNRE